MSLIEISNLNFEYIKARPVLFDIKYSIDENTTNVILGLNGCGKTTLIKILAGLLKPICGSINIDGKPIFKMSDYERSKYIAYVPQFATSKIPFKVKEYLELSLTNQKSIYWRSGEDEVKLKQFAEKYKIDKFFDRPMNELSGGERQKIMICAAIFQDSKIIILDEPTASLDIKNQYEVLQFLKECNTDNRTIILTCHDPNHVLRLDANAIVLHDGKIAFNNRNSPICAKDLKSIYGENICDVNIGNQNYFVVL